MIYFKFKLMIVIIYEMNNNKKKRLHIRSYGMNELIVSTRFNSHAEYSAVFSSGSFLNAIKINPFKVGRPSSL